MRSFIVIIALLNSFLSSGQDKNAYKFIEPNISFSYDSNLYQITNRYSNSVYETEAYDFKSKNAKARISIHIKADHPDENPISKNTVDSLMTLRIPLVLKAKEPDVTLLDYDKKKQACERFYLFWVGARG